MQKSGFQCDMHACIGDYMNVNYILYRLSWIFSFNIHDSRLYSYSFDVFIRVKLCMQNGNLSQCINGSCGSINPVIVGNHEKLSHKYEGSK